MAITDSQYKTLILLDVNDTVSGPVGSNIDLIWDIYADKALIKNAPRLQYLYAKRHAIGVMLSYLRSSAVDLKNDSTEVKNSGLLTNLQSRLSEVESEIEKVEKQARLIRPSAIGALTNVEPISPASDSATTLLPDPSDRIYRGDPLKPPLERRII